jgi:hypothetical protein
VGARLPGRVAQLVERAPEKREVTGSTPVPTTGKAQVISDFDDESNSEFAFRAQLRAQRK